MDKTKPVANVRCHVGDLVEFDCPDNPERHGHSARVIGLAGFNGPDWWEVDMLSEFFVIPDTENPGSYIKTSQSFAPDSILVPYECVRREGASAAALPPGDLFYVVNSHSGIIYGPAMLIDDAKRKAARYGRADIVPAMLLDETVAGARELSQDTRCEKSDAHDMPTLTYSPGRELSAAADLAITAQAFSTAQPSKTVTEIAQESEHARAVLLPVAQLNWR